MNVSAKDFISGLVAGLGGASGIWAVIERIRTNRSKERTLRALLEDPDYRYRTIRKLHGAIGGRPKTVDDCRNTIELLLRMGAKEHGQQGGSIDPLDQLWGL